MNILLVEPPNPSKRERLFLPEGMGRLTAYLKKKGFCVKQISLDAKCFPIHNHQGISVLKETIKVAKYLCNKKDKGVEDAIAKLSDMTEYDHFDVIGFSICTYLQFAISILMARHIKAQSNRIKTVFGGSIFNSFNPESMHEYKEAPDYIIAGEGELPFLRLLDFLKNGRTIKLDSIGGLIYCRDGEIVQNKKACLPINSLPFPDYDDLIKDYREACKRTGVGLRIAYQVSRGCIGRCAFCNFKGGYNLSLKQPKIVARDTFRLAKKYGVDKVIFACNSINLNNANVEELCYELIKTKSPINWECYARPDSLSFRLLKLMKKAGCYQLNYGIESASPRLLKHLNKGLTIKKVEKIIRATKKAGINVWANFMFNTPYEKKEDLLKTISFIEKNKVYIRGITFSRFSFSFGSRCYKEGTTLVKELRRYAFYIQNRHCLKQLSKITKKGVIKVDVSNSTNGSLIPNCIRAGFRRVLYALPCPSAKHVRPEISELSFLIKDNIFSKLDS
jgi:radical SAM superfamily enzyme YgiQ (UPF0313 family)